MQGLEQFKNEKATVWRNMERDQFLHDNPAEKEALIDAVSRLYSGPDTSELEQFFASKALLGPTITLEPNESLGRFQSRAGTIKHLAERFDADPDLIDSMLESWTTDDSEDALSIIKMFGEGFAVTKSTMWGFRNPNDSEDPFSGYPVDALPCILGLKYAHYPLLYFSYCPDVEPHLPTSLDAGLYDAWAPGGKTKPLPPCRPRFPSGLPEVVHTPITFDTLTKPIREFKP